MAIPKPNPAEYSPHYTVRADTKEVLPLLRRNCELNLGKGKVCGGSSASASGTWTCEGGLM